MLTSWLVDVMKRLLWGTGIAYFRFDTPIPWVAK